MKIGKFTTLDKLGRITLNKEVRDLFMMEEGDKLSYYTEDGKVYIKKDTTLYGEYDFENEMIEDRVIAYEKTMKMMNRSEFDDWEFENPNYKKEEDYDDVDPRVEEMERENLQKEFMDDIAKREQERKIEREKKN